MRFGSKVGVALAASLLLVACWNTQKLGDRFDGVPSDVTPTQLLEQVKAWQMEREPVRYYEHLNIGAPVKSARSLQQLGFRVRNHAAFSVEPPLNWAADPYDDRNWRFQLNSIYPAITYLQAYRATGEKAWFEEAVQLYLDWVDFNLWRDLPNEFKWYDMATGIRAINLGYMIDHGVREGLLDADELAQLARAADRHVAELVSQRLAHSNHGLFQVAGIAAVCRALPKLERCDEAADYANAGFALLFDGQFNAEGMHLEHSPDYHVFALDVIRQMVNADFFDLDPRHVETLQKAIANYHWLLKPDLTNPAIGDTARAGSRGLRRLHPTLEYMFSEGNHGTRPPGGVRIFEETGYAFVRHYSSPEAVRAASYIMLSIAHHSNVHKHADPFTFEWFDRGESILIDAGKWGYDYAEERDYVVSTRAHNTVEIDSENDETQNAPEVLPVLSGIVSQRDFYVLMANGERRPSGVRHRRLLVLQPGEWLLVADRLLDDDARKYVQWFHPAESFECGRAQDELAFLCSMPGLQMHVRSLVVVDSLRHERGTREPRLQGWVSPTYGSLVPSDALGFVREEVRRGIFVTLFDLSSDGFSLPVVAFDDNRLEACWTNRGGRAGAVVEWGDTGDLRVSACPQ